MKKNDRISLTHKINANEVFSFGRDHGHFGRILNQTVISLPGNEQTVMGSGIWDGEKWQVVFVRKLRSDSKQKVDFSIGQSFPIAFAIWNGDEKDRNGQKMVSTWYQLDLKD